MKVKYDRQEIYDLCKEHMHAYVMAELVDDSRFDGIITGLDYEYVYFAVPVDHQQHAFPSLHHTLKDTKYNYPPRRFNRIIVPLAAMTNLHSLPWY